jgi:hypothetical protein
MVFFFFFFFPIKVLLAFGLCTGASSYFLNFKKLQEIPKKKKKKKKNPSLFLRVFLQINYSNTKITIY